MEGISIFLSLALLKGGWGVKYYKQAQQHSHSCVPNPQKQVWKRQYYEQLQMITFHLLIHNQNLLMWLLKSFCLYIIFNIQTNDLFQMDDLVIMSNYWSFSIRPFGTSLNRWFLFWPTKFKKKNSCLITFFGKFFSSQQLCFYNSREMLPIFDLPWRRVRKTFCHMRGPDALACPRLTKNRALKLRWNPSRC